MIYQLKIQLQGVTKPPVWRRILIPSDASFASLHKVIQKAFGWNDCHAYSFSEKPYDGGWEVSEGKTKTTPIKEYLNSRCPKITYIYDFGDNWTHMITLEETNVKGVEEPERAHCTAGKGICPPEDIGGAGGFALIKEFCEEHPQRAIRAAKGTETEAEVNRGFKDEYDEEACDLIRDAGLFFNIVDKKPDFSQIDLEPIE